MKESISIENFSCIQKAEIDFNKFTILIGPQATGKSIIAKLFYFFKKVPGLLVLEESESQTKRKVDKNIAELFEKYFPSKYLQNGEFAISYHVNDEYIKISKIVSRTGSYRIKIDYSEVYNHIRADFKKLLKLYREKTDTEPRDDEFLFSDSPEIRARNKISLKYKKFFDNSIFIPAGRSFFSNIENIIFTLLSKNQGIDPFLQEFGAFYESIKRRHLMSRKAPKSTESLRDSILRGEYFQDKGKDFIKFKDGRLVGMENASSGQQEALPLYLMLSWLFHFRHPSQKRTIFIEEPEAHIFPDAQNLLVETIVSLFNARESTYNFIITTHSPYILSTFNNLAFAGSIINKVNAKDVGKIININSTLNPKYLSAYITKGDGVEKIICGETSLIDAESIDSVSNKLSKQFDDLMNLGGI